MWMCGACPGCGRKTLEVGSEPTSAYSLLSDAPWIRIAWRTVTSPLPQEEQRIPNLPTMPLLPTNSKACCSSTTFMIPLLGGISNWLHTTIYINYVFNGQPMPPSSKAVPYVVRFPTGTFYPSYLALREDFPPNTSKTLVIGILETSRTQ